MREVSNKINFRYNFINSVRGLKYYHYFFGRIYVTSKTPTFQNR